jgi:phosphoglycerate dehydrogenase-like enzyme
MTTAERGGRPDVDVLYLDTVTEERRELLRQATPPGMRLTLWDELDARQAEQALAAAEYVVVASRPIGPELLDRAPRLRLVQKAGVGIDNVDLAAAAHRGVAVAHTPGINTTSVAEMTLLLVLALYRRLLVADAETRTGRWPMWTMRSLCFELRDKVHGILGLGRIGRRVAELSRAFGTEVLYHDLVRPTASEERALGVRFVDRDELLRSADVLSLHVPLTPLTRHTIGAPELALMKPTAVLVNVARGGVVAENALVAALRAGGLAGAAVDVWETEPVDPDHPLLGMPQVVATSHLAGASSEATRAVIEEALANVVRAARDGGPWHVVAGGADA